MSLLQPYIEHPNLRIPIALIVDDAAPCINPLWYFRHQVDKQVSPACSRTIPLSFMETWCNWICETDVRGDFTILPYPAGLGRIDRGLDGYDRGDVREWLRLAQSALTCRFDIHPEIMTHTNALDLKTYQLLPISEHDWSSVQSETVLAEYFAAAMQILRDAGIPNNGVTQPCYYHNDEALYARAVLAAEERVNCRSVTHNFLQEDSVSPMVPPRITYIDRAAGKAVVSIWSAGDDYTWNTQEEGAPEQHMSPHVIADRLLTADGRSGRIADLIRGGGPIVLLTHWQSLYSNGAELGLNTYREVVPRIASHLGERVEWCKLSKIAEHHLAAATARMEPRILDDGVEVDVATPFDTDTLTISIPMPWPVREDPTVFVDGAEIGQARDAASLVSGQWVMRGSVVTVSVGLRANQSRRMAIKSAKPFLSQQF